MTVLLSHPVECRADPEGPGYTQKYSDGPGSNQANPEVPKQTLKFLTDPEGYV